VWYLDMLVVRYRLNRHVSQCTVPNAPRGHAYDQATTVCTRRPRPVPVLGYLVVYLIECRENIVGKLNFCNRSHALSSSSDSEAYQALLAEWCVEDALRAKVCCEVHGASEDAAKLYVFSEHQHSFIRL
jgi:hypothetical protein